jgi:DNA replication licensing factor MCM6
VRDATRRPPARLLRRITPARPPPAVGRIRELKTRQIGNLVTISGTVTRTSEVRPELIYGRFHCKGCGMLSNMIEQQFKFTEPPNCSNVGCTNRDEWILDVSSSRFADWQSLRVQENADEIPAGSLPRTVTVILRHGVVDRAKAGDKCLFVREPRGGSTASSLLYLCATL